MYHTVQYVTVPAPRTPPTRVHKSTITRRLDLYENILPNTDFV